MPIHSKYRHTRGTLQDNNLTGPLNHYIRALMSESLKRTSPISETRPINENNDGTCLSKTCPLIKIFQRTHLMTDHFGRM